MRPTLFSGGEGFGYIAHNSDVAERFLPEPAEFKFATVQAGTKTDLAGFFSRPIEYLGRDGKELLFLKGVETDLFGGTYYYEAIFLISPTRLYMHTNPLGGRDYNFVNGKWK